MRCHWCAMFSQDGSQGRGAHHPLGKHRAADASSRTCCRTAISHQRHPGGAGQFEVRAQRGGVPARHRHRQHRVSIPRSRSISTAARPHYRGPAAGLGQQIVDMPPPDHGRRHRCSGAGASWLLPKIVLLAPSPSSSRALRSVPAATGMQVLSGATAAAPGLSTGGPGASTAPP
jgi:hypothetical protein